MPNYFIGYKGGSKPATPEEGAKHMEKYRAWYMGLGDAVVSPDTPLMNSKSVSSGETLEAGADRLIGFMIVSASDMDAALEIARACPFLEMDNTAIEVAEVMKM